VTILEPACLREVAWFDRPGPDWYDFPVIASQRRRLVVQAHRVADNIPADNATRVIHGFLAARAV
jgi:hypothetical protein